MVMIFTHLSTIQIKNLKISKFVILSPVNQERVFLYGYPSFLLRHTLLPMSSQFGSAVVPCVPHGWDDRMKPPECWQLGFLYNWVGVFHIKVDDNESSKNLTWRGVYPLHTPMVLLQWPSSVSSCGGCPVHNPMASMGWDIYPSTKSTWSC